jgi:uncharacterized membrane protein YqjE
MEKTETVVHGPGLIRGLTGLAKNLFGLIVTRVELAAVELSEVRNHILELVAIFALGILAALFALAYGTATIVALAWDTMGWTILLLMFVVFLALAVGLVLKARAMLREGRLALPQTMNELKNDRDMLL